MFILPQRPEEAFKSAGAKVNRCCQLPRMGAGNEALVLCKSSKRSLTVESSLQHPVLSSQVHIPVYFFLGIAHIDT